MRTAMILAVLPALLFAQAGHAAATYTIEPVTTADEKAVFATVESRNVVPARVRTGGTIAGISVKEGDRVEQGQVLATVGDPKLILQQASLDAQIAGLQAQLVQAQTEFGRAQQLLASGAMSKAQFDADSTTFNVATNSVRARIAERAVVAQQLTEGQVLAPAAGRVLTVPFTPGTVVMSGETIATIAEQDFVLRLRVPERHARFLKAGDQVRLAGDDLAGHSAAFGTVSLVYPQIQDGRVVADAQVAGLEDYFVGERIRVWISGGDRRTFIVPATYITTRFGLDYARLRQKDGTVIDVPVQRGRGRPRPDMPDALEILSGLRAGDILVQP